VIESAVFDGFFKIFISTLLTFSAYLRYSFTQLLYIYLKQIFMGVE
jgi:hypothetical protein